MPSRKKKRNNSQYNRL